MKRGRFLIAKLFDDLFAEYADEFLNGQKDNC